MDNFEFTNKKKNTYYFTLIFEFTNKKNTHYFTLILN